MVGILEMMMKTAVVSLGVMSTKTISMRFVRLHS